MHQHDGIRVLGLQRQQLLGLELVVHDARTLPQQHVGAGLATDVVAQVPVRPPDELFSLRLEVGDDLQRHRRRDDPVGTRLHGGAGVGIHHHRPVRMLVAEGRELVLGAAQVQRAFCFQIRHQHRLVRAEDLGAFAHEAHAGHHQHPRRMGGAESGHLQRIAHAAAGFQGQILDVGIHVVVGHQHGIAFVQQGRNAFFQRPGLIGAQGIGHLGPGLPDAAGRGGGLRVG